MSDEPKQEENESKYNFYRDVMNITKRKWKELERTEDEIEKQQQAQVRDIQKEVRQSKEYMMEFVLTITDLLGNESADPSPYLHTCKYILQNFDTFEAMENDLYSRYGDNIYISSLEESDLNQEQFQEFVGVVDEYAESYVHEYMKKMGAASKALPPTWMQKVFQATLLIMLELEMDFVAFFDVYEE